MSYQVRPGPFLSLGAILRHLNDVVGYILLIVGIFGAIAGSVVSVLAIAGAIMIAGDQVSYEIRRRK